jgi:hypothetical protein
VLPIASILDVLHRARPDAWYLVELAQLGDHEVDEQAWIARDVGWLRECLSA